MLSHMKCHGRLFGVALVEAPHTLSAPMNPVSRCERVSGVSCSFAEERITILQEVGRGRTLWFRQMAAPQAQKTRDAMVTRGVLRAAGVLGDEANGASAGQRGIRMPRLRSMPKARRVGI